jgi:VCBS repeat-containing protein
MMSRHTHNTSRRSFCTVLIGVCSMLAIAVGVTTTMRASDNLDFQINGPIYDVVWDSRLFDGTPGFPGAILWHHNASGMPSNFSQASFEASIEASFNTWESVDNGVPEEPLVPVVDFGGSSTATDAFALDGVNLVTWKPDFPDGMLAVTPCWGLDAPTTTTTDSQGRTVLPVDGGASIPFSGPPGVTYPVGTVIDCGMQFDNLDPWSTTPDPDPNSFDVQAIATHEGGHFIGVSHSTLGDFTASNPMSATMLPVVAPGDANNRTLEEDDKAAILRIYARNRFSGAIPQTVGGRGLITLRLLKDGACVPATGVSVVAYRTQSGIDGANRIETFSGSQLRAFTLNQPFNGSAALNVPPLASGESYTIYARTMETGSGELAANRYNYTTINSNLLDTQNHSRTFDQLATISSLAAGETRALGDIGILGCSVADPNSPVNLVAQSITAPATAYKGSTIAVSSTFSNQGAVAAGAFQVGVYFSIDQTINQSDIFSGFSCAVPNLASGDVAQCNGSAPVPSAVQPGNYYVGLIVDRQNEVVENTESDNGIAAANATTVLRNPLDPIVNGSFETGDLSGWTVKELTPASNPNLPLSVRGAGVEYPAPTFLAFPYFIILDYFTSAPTDGQYALLNDFNGNDPATSGFVNRRELYQDVTLPASTTTLEFDYRAAWELFRFNSTQPRTFGVEIEPAGGGTPLLTRTILTAPDDTYEEDTDNPSGGVGDYPPAVIDLSGFRSQSVRVKFVWNIPEPGTGFGFFQLDNIRLNADSAPPPTNTAPTAGNQTVATNEDTPVSVTLPGFDAEQCELQFSIVTGPAKGTLGAITNNGCTSGTPNADTAVLTYTPGANLTGSDSFTFRVSDGSLTADATVGITINAINDAPIAANRSVSTVVGSGVTVVMGATDLDGCELAFSVVQLPSSGTLGAIANDACAPGNPGSDTARVTYTPAATGIHTFTYKASDGVTDSNIATVTVTVDAAPPPDTMHVGDLDGSSSAMGRGSWRATVSAGVHDSNHAALSGATVTGLWSGGASGSGSCTTDATGRCSIPSPSIANSKKNVTFTVTSVSNSLTYAAAENHDADGDGGGTAITVKKP